MTSTLYHDGVLSVSGLVSIGTGVTTEVIAGVAGKRVKIVGAFISSSVATLVEISSNANTFLRADVKLVPSQWPPVDLGYGIGEVGNDVSLSHNDAGTVFVNFNLQYVFLD